MSEKVFCTFLNPRFSLIPLNHIIREREKGKEAFAQAISPEAAPAPVLS